MAAWRVSSWAGRAAEETREVKAARRSVVGKSIVAVWLNGEVEGVEEWCC